MTTTIKVQAHQWPVSVTAIDKGADGETRRTETFVPLGSEQTHHIHSGRDLLLVELPADAEAFDPREWVPSAAEPFDFERELALLVQRAAETEDVSDADIIGALSLMASRIVNEVTKDDGPTAA